jgi:Family of unknown function (DUF6152)
MRSRLVAGFVAMGVIGFAVSAWSHHAHGNYAVDTVDFEGVVTELHLLVPHSWVYLEVTKADGQKQLWALEAGGRGQLTKQGITVKPGDKIKVRCHPLMDKTPGCLLGFVKTQDGTVTDWDGGPSNTVPEDF